MEEEEEEEEEREEEEEEEPEAKTQGAAGKLETEFPDASLRLASGMPRSLCWKRTDCTH